MAEAKGEEPQWIGTQKKTFTKWFNNHLRKKGHPIIEDVLNSWEDGTQLMYVVNALYDIPIPKHNPHPKMRPHKLDNLALALGMVEQAQIKTNFLKATHLIDKDLKMILGMMWAIILDYAIKGISVDEMTAKEGLLLWVQKKTKGYRDVDPPGVKNFSKDWKTGMVFCALIHRHFPALIDYDALDKKNDAANLELAFSVAEKQLDIPRLLEVEDLTGTDMPDERSVMTYVAEYFHRFASQDIKEDAARRVANFVKFMRGVEAQQFEYERRARALIQWCQDTCAALSATNFGETLEDAMQVFDRFKTHVTREKPHKAAEKLDVEALLAEIQTELRVNHRRPYSPPDDCNPDAVERAWDALVQAERSHGVAVRDNRFRFVTREEHELPQELIDEFTRTFRLFDKSGNNRLDFVEFKAGLVALGVPFKDDDAARAIHARISEGHQLGVSLEQWIAYNTTLREDKDTPEQLKSSFGLMSDQAPTISEAQLNMPPLTADDTTFLRERMPAAADGRLDYSTFVDSQFAEN